MQSKCVRILRSPRSALGSWRAGRPKAIRRRPSEIDSAIKTTLGRDAASERNSFTIDVQTVRCDSIYVWYIIIDTPLTNNNDSAVFFIFCYLRFELP